MPTPAAAAVEPDLVAVALHGVYKSYDATPALDGLTFYAPTAAITALLGRNGAGKSTTVGICTGQLRADRGGVRVLDLHPRSEAADLKPRVGVMPQAAGSGAAGVHPSARVREVVKLFAGLAASPLDVDALLERLDLTRLARAQWRRLSGGEQQRVSLALAIVGRPELLFLDEPTAGLDVHARRSVWSLLDDLRTAGVTIVLATHTMEEAERLADHVVVIDKGRAAAAGSVAELTGHGEPRLVFDAAAGLPVDDLTVRLPAGLVVKETTPGHYVIDGAADAHLVANVTSWCAQQDVLVHRIDTERRTLEDVFLDLTGRPVE